jgi:NADH-quinone oxidoreductase subunit A
LSEYIPLAIFIFLGGLIGTLAMVLAKAISFRSPDGVMKKTPYECGAEIYGNARIQFKVGYYRYALLFLLFDIESLFLFPCLKIYRAVAEGRVPTVSYGLLVVELSVFLSILLLGLMYAWRKGALTWE